MNFGIFMQYSPFLFRMCIVSFRKYVILLRVLLIMVLYVNRFRSDVFPRGRSLLEILTDVKESLTCSTCLILIIITTTLAFQNKKLCVGDC